MNDVQHYQHYISLGYFCSTAMELERIGLRSESSPFDWCITPDIGGVVDAIEDHFSHLFTYDYLAQLKKYPQYYRNTKYRIDFYHDFDPYRPLVKQLPEVEEKYKRRINRFYESISEPTLFIRYINDEERSPVDGKAMDIRWIEENYNYLMAFLQAYNKKNGILFVANKGVESDLVRIYTVDKDDNDSVARHFLDKNAELRSFFDNQEFPKREENLLFYQENQAHKNQRKTGLIPKIKNELDTSIKRHRRPYIHERTV